MINILYFLYFFGAFILSILILPAPYDNGFGIVICLSIFIVIPILFRLAKYLILMLKTKHLLKKKGFKTTKFCYFPFPSRLRGRYNMSFENDNKVINVVFLSKKLKYKNYHFENENLVKFSSYARVMLYHGNGPVCTDHAFRELMSFTKTILASKKSYGPKIISKKIITILYSLINGPIMLPILQITTTKA